MAANGLLRWQRISKEKKPIIPPVTPVCSYGHHAWYGRRGDIENAKERFERHYASAVAEYQDRMTNGRKLYLKKGERAVFMGQDITAEQDGYVTLYGANRGHIDYLDQLAVQLGLR